MREYRCGWNATMSRPAASGSRGAKHRRDLGRVVPVVVEHLHARRCALALEPSLGALESREPRGDGLERHAELQRHRDGGKRVLQVVPSGDREAERAERPVQLPAARR